tara:strand:- start:973 stop:2241 length:1269 start_codon:yes stop_codon:yes gene_type:complete
MLDNILFILGIKAYVVSIPFVSKIDIFRDEVVSFPREKFKLMYKLNLVKYSETEEDEFKVGIKYKKDTDLTVSEKVFYLIYTIYFISVNVLLWMQSVYNFRIWVTTSDMRHLVSFLTHINVPLMHIWAKQYYRCNHMEKIINCERFKSIIIIICTTLSLVTNFIDIPAFHNEYMWPTVITDNKYIFFTIILIDWIYSRLLCFLFLFTIIFILKEHISEINGLIYNLSLPPEYFVENACVSNLIMDVSATKNKISKTIYLLNPIISFSTLIGAANMSLFIRGVLPNDNITIYNTFNNFIPFDRYIFVCIIIYTIIQTSLLFYIYTYTSKRETILDYIKSYIFIKSFLYRLPINLLKSEDINVINASTTFDVANSVEWLILCDILSNRWVDFTIFGVSTSDGKLILKGITLGGSILFIMTFITK